MTLMSSSLCVLLTPPLPFRERRRGRRRQTREAREHVQDRVSWHRVACYTTPDTLVLPAPASHERRPWCASVEEWVAHGAAVAATMAALGQRRTLAARHIDTCAPRSLRAAADHHRGRDEQHKGHEEQRKRNRRAERPAIAATAAALVARRQVLCIHSARVPREQCERKRKRRSQPPLPAPHASTLRSDLGSLASMPWQRLERAVGVCTRFSR